MRVLTIGYTKLLVPENVDLGNIVESISRMEEVDTTYVKGDYLYYKSKKDSLEVSVKTLSDKVIFNSLESAKASAQTEEPE